MKTILTALISLVFSLASNATTDHLRVLTLNTWQLTGVASTYVHGVFAKNKIDRIRNVAKVVNLLKSEKNRELHILTFQELFDDHAKKDLIKHLDTLDFRKDKNKKIYKDRFPFHVDDPKKSGNVVLNSGLAIFSKYKIVDSHLHYFKHFKGEENMAWKGVLMAKIKLPSQKIITVATTHMQTGGNDWWKEVLDDLNGTGGEDAKEIKVKQATEIREQLISFNQRHPKSQGSLVTGDFNLGTRVNENNGYVKDEHFIRALDVLEGHDLHDFSKDEEGVIGSVWEEKGDKTKNKTIDQIIWTRVGTQNGWPSLLNLERSFANTIKDFKRPNSDHLGVIADLYL